MLERLKSGTDIRGIASEMYGKTVTLTEEAVFRISCGFADFVKKETGGDPPKIAVGNDCRVTADRIKRSVISALTSKGAEVFDCGLASTPAMFMATVLGGMTAAIQITASHHPADRNGLKFFLRGGGLDSKQLDEVLALAERNAAGAPGEGVAPFFPVMDMYCEHLRETICRRLNKRENDMPLAGLHIAVDAGNGVGGFYATQVLNPLGADTSGSVFLEPDGRFPNHVPNPENEDAMRSVCRAVTDAKADFGVIFDTDVDRAACVDGNGREINRNRLIALASAIVLEREPGCTVVTDSVTSDGLADFITSLGGKQRRFKRGYKNVIDEARRLNDIGVNAPLAIETSGHAAFGNNYFLDDGAYLITEIIVKLVKLRRAGKDISDLIATLRLPAEEREYRFPITAEKFSEYGDRVLAELAVYCAKNKKWRLADDSCEGVRVSVDGGFFIMRKSVHDPMMVLNLESDSPGGTDALLRELRAFLYSREQLDISSLEA